MTRPSTPLLWPGGICVCEPRRNRAADNEAQLAGVMAHELSHVALRHGTNQATKAMLADTVLGSSARYRRQRGRCAPDNTGQFHGRRRASPLFANGRVTGRRPGHSGPLRCGVRPASHGTVFSRSLKRRRRGRTLRSFSPTTRIRSTASGASMKKSRSSGVFRRTPRETPLNSKPSSTKSWRCRW